MFISITSITAKKNNEKEEKISIPTKFDIYEDNYIQRNGSNVFLIIRKLYNCDIFIFGCTYTHKYLIFSVFPLL